MKVLIRCLTDGAVVCGKKLRAGQEIELDITDEQIAHLVTVEAAGDIAIKSEHDEIKAFRDAVESRRAEAEAQATASAPVAAPADNVMVTSDHVADVAGDVVMAEHDKP